MQINITELINAAKVFEDRYERSICHHETTNRGGAIWTICDDCGAKWADDEGGFKGFEYPPEVEQARAVLAAAIAARKAWTKQNA